MGGKKPVTRGDNRVTKLNIRSKIKKLKEIFKGKNSLLILMQDNPDPDSIAAAIALRKLANSLGDIKCAIAHGGTVGRGENRALVHYLNLNLYQCDQIIYEKYDLIGMVDTQPGTGNNSLPEIIVPDIVFDHHPIKKITRSAKFFDIRSKYGATSTIFFEYLTELNIEIDMHLATALLYAIQSDTQDLGREATNADIKAIEILYLFANKRMLSEIQHGSVQREYFKTLTEALNNAYVYENCVISNLGVTNNPDMIAEAADLLLRDENIESAICYGYCQDKLLFSVRTTVSLKIADKIAKYIAARRGTGGGHQTYAGGQIPLNNQTAPQLKKLEKVIRNKALHILSINCNGGKKLI
ncbi:MAG TPA: bifunctional oligoribonuclease/PAP phosphatase NrnA [Sedimentisphaerales bacterium]|nr:bifunctional oligoribonuclease/PAP phosphatase NrnA [Sedimentisphaerales bacterium]